MPKIFLYNTLTRKKEEFHPLKKEKVGLYTCGPTVYNYAHLGNLRTYIFEDILKRVLEYNGYQVKHVENITDVGHLTDDADQGVDKMEKAAQQQKKSAWQLAEFYTEAFKKDLARLNILQPKIWCKATDHIKLQIDTIKKIEANGFTYRTSDGIYFDTSKLANYGELARLDKENLKAGARIEMGEKRNATDFALWKFSKPEEKRQMEWDSPWGVGFPGWHIECSAMSTHYLGIPFDIHCGGIDHIPIHHTNEIAQTKAAEDKKMANFWLHGEFMVIADKRMGKSVGNFITLETLIKKNFNPLAYRYLALNTHYRQKLNFTWKALESAQNALDKLYLSIPLVKKTKSVCDKHLTDFRESINNDLNTPRALAVVWDLLRSECPPEIKLSSLLDYDQILGLRLEEIYEQKMKKLKKIPAAVKKLLFQRKQARQAKNWQLADRLRDDINKLGYLVTDTDNGQQEVNLK